MLGGLVRIKKFNQHFARGNCQSHVKQELKGSSHSACKASVLPPLHKGLTQHATLEGVQPSSVTCLTFFHRVFLCTIGCSCCSPIS